MLNSVIYVNKCKIKSGVSGHQLASNLITVSGNSVIGGSFLLVVWLTVCWLTGVRVLEVVLPVPLRPICLGLQRHQRHVHRLWAWDQAGKNGGRQASLSPIVRPVCFVWSKVPVFQFKPLEQLMGVFPAASGNFLPPTWRSLMSNPVSFT